MNGSQPFWFVVGGCGSGRGVLLGYGFSDATCAWSRMRKEPSVDTFMGLDDGGVHTSGDVIGIAHAA